MQDNYCVYMHIFPNKKKYIGISNSPFNRWGKSGEGYSGQLVYNAIKKYGWENIKHEILHYDCTEQEAKELEAFYIDKYKTCVLDDNNCGYNATFGGDSGTVKRLKIYKYNKKLELIGVYDGYKEALDSLNMNNLKSFSSICNCCNHNIKTAYGFIWRKEGDTDLFDSVDDSCRKIAVYDICGNIIELFDDYIKASKKYHMRGTPILKCCRTKSTYRGYIFRFADEAYIPPKITMRKIVGISSEGNIVRYDSISDASKSLKCSYQTILNCLKKRNGCKRCGGYFWRYEDEYDEKENFSCRVGNKVNEYLMDMTFVQTHDSIVDAARYICKINGRNLHSVQGGISNCCRGVIKYSNNRIWRYSNTI